MNNSNLYIEFPLEAGRASSRLTSSRFGFRSRKNHLRTLFIKKSVYSLLLTKWRRLGVTFLFLNPTCRMASKITERLLYLWCEERWGKRTHFRAGDEWPRNPPVGWVYFASSSKRFRRFGARFNGVPANRAWHSPRNPTKQIIWQTTERRGFGHLAPKCGWRRRDSGLTAGY